MCGSAGHISRSVAALDASRTTQALPTTVGGPSKCSPDENRAIRFWRTGRAYAHASKGLSDVILAISRIVVAAIWLNAAAASAQPTLPPELVEITWEWIGLTTTTEQLTVHAPERYTIVFRTDGRVAVGADCNRGSGSYSIGGNRRVTWGPMALTRAACPPDSHSDRFVRELSRATSFFLKDGDLFLELPIDSGTLRFRPKV